MKESFLLSTPAARRLYEEHAAGLPIIDYHCHIDPNEIALDKHYENITQAWPTAFVAIRFTPVSAMFVRMTSPR